MYITQNKLFKLALYSNVVYVLLLFLVRPEGINFKKVIITSLLLFSAVAIILLAISNWKRLKDVPKYPRALFYLLIFWGIIIIIRGFSFSIQDWVTNFGNVYMGFAWLVPLTLVLGLKIENWKIIFKVLNFTFNLMIFIFIISFFVVDDYLKWSWLLRPVNFILLVAFYKYGLLNKLRVFIIIGIYIFASIQVEQRMDLLYLVMVLGLVSIDKLFTYKVQRKFLKYIFAGFIIAFSFVFTVGYETVSNVIASIVEFQDSRTFLFTEIFQELSKTNDLFFGRGSLGTYFSEFFEHTRKYWEHMGRIGWSGDAAIRITVEVGYLQILLKGGFLMMLLNVLLYIYTIYKALFKSNNKFIKRLGYYILIISTLSLVSFRPTFAPTFILFWMAIGTVLNKKYRNMSNLEIEKIIQI